MANAGAAAPASEVNNIIAGSTKKPVVRLVASGTQSIPNNTATPVAFTTEDFDTNNFHDTVTNNTRITPNKAGYYTIRGTYFSAARADYTTLDCAVGKNGVQLAPADRKTFSTAATQVSNAASASCEALVQANGTTDYFELIAFQVNAAATATLTSQSGRFSSVLECVFEREL